jgi:SAM-dependent methyltransferase
MTPVEQVQTILNSITDDSLGGSANGVAYQDYPWHPFDAIPAAFRTTQRKLDIIKRVVRLKEKTVLDFGCANGAVTIGLALEGAKVYGVDVEPAQLGAGRIVARSLGVDVQFSTQASLAHCDAIIYLSVWKWTVRHQGRKVADAQLRRLSESCDVLLFDAGVGDCGTDLGVGLKVSEVPTLVLRATPMANIAKAGAFVDNNNIPRTIWKCLRQS